MNRELRHPPYYAISGYEIIARKSERECADAIGKSLRTYQDKKKGYSDFTKSEADILSSLLKQPLSLLFVT